MSVSSTLRKQQFVLNGTTAAFTFTFRALVSAPANIKCIATDGAGVDTDLVYTTEYTVAINASGIGGVVTLVSPATVGAGALTVYRETTNKQESDYDDYNQFPADTLETDLDIRTLVSQEREEETERALRVPISTPVGVDYELPSPVPDKAIGWDSLGTGLANLSIVGPTGPAGPAGPGSGDVLGPASNTDLKVPQWNGANTKTLKDGLAVGVLANNLLQLDATAKIPAVDGSALTGIIPTQSGHAGEFLKTDASVVSWAALTQVGLGSWVDKTADYGAQQATTDGFVVGYGIQSGTGYILTKTDAANPPTTIRSKCVGANTISLFTISPIKKSDYWLVEVSNVTITAVYWIPLGS